MENVDFTHFGDLKLLVTAGAPSIFTRPIDVNAVCAEFRNAAPQDRQAEVSRVMKWWEVLVDCFTGKNQKKALELLFDIAQAEKANDNAQLSFTDKLANREIAKQAFCNLERYALPGYQFSVVPNASSHLCFKITDSRNDEALTIPAKFNYFDTEKADAIWKQVRGSFVEGRASAIELINQMVNATTSVEKIDCFAKLTRLADPEHREHFKMNLTDEWTSTLNITIGYKNESLLDTLECPRPQMEDTINALLSSHATLSMSKGEYSTPDTQKKLSMILRLQANFAAKGEPTRAAAAKILKDMFQFDRTAQDDLKAFSRLMKLDPKIRELLEVAISPNDAGKPRISLVFDGKPFNHGVITDNANWDLANLDLRGANLRGLNLNNANLTGTDLRGADLTDAQLQGAQVQGAKFDPTVLMGGLLSDAQIKTLETDAAATTLQSIKRARKATTTLQDPDAWVPVLKDSNGEVLGYKIGWGPGKYPWVAPPPLDLGEDGGNKWRTGMNDELVELTIKDPDAFESVNTFTKQTLDFIVHNNLDRLIPQIRVSRSKLIARNMGKNDLFGLVNGGEKFAPSCFKDLARQLQFLHKNGYVHRDIKIGNMFFKSGQMYLSDLDTMGKPGEFRYKGFAGTREYAHPDLIGNRYNTDSNDAVNAVKLDQYAFINSMIAACTGTLTETGIYPEQTIAQFIKGLPCDAASKKNLADFLLNPVTKSLKYDLDTYL